MTNDAETTWRTLKVAPTPGICEPCSDRLMNSLINTKPADAEDQIAQFLHYCPHGKCPSLIHLQLEDQGDELVITKWLFEGPITEAHFLDQAAKLQKLLGGKLEIANGSTLQ